MNNKAMYKFSYGLFVLTTSYEGKDNGCIINTAIQAASEPVQISIALNKANYTHELITRSNKFNVSVLTQDAPYDIFKLFGHQSGRNIDKFKDFGGCVRAENGIYYINEYTNAYFSVDVTDSCDMGSHTMFIGVPTAVELLSDAESMSYGYYQSDVKPKPEALNTEPGKTVWVCRICGYVYEGEELPADYICPVCKHPASDFEKVTS